MLTSKSTDFTPNSKPTVTTWFSFSWVKLGGRGIHLRENNTEMFRPKKMFLINEVPMTFSACLKLALQLRLVNKRVTRKMELEVCGYIYIYMYINILLIFVDELTCLSLDSFAFT